jgi:hypothetical protein
MKSRDYRDSLNKSFYRARPHEYFHHRLLTLLLLLTKEEEVAVLVEPGLKYGFVTVAIGEKTSEERPVSPLRSFASCESQVLVHHIGEVLLRLFLAHRGLASCPALELASLRLPRSFKDGVRSLLAQPEVNRRIDLMEVFWGDTSIEKLSNEHPANDWESGLAALDRLVIHAASRLLSEAALYNAAKHGLSLTAGRSALTVDIEGIDLGMSTTGLNVEYLERVGQEGSTEQWRHVTRWIDDETDIAVCYLWTHLMESLWSVATNRYLGTDTYSIYSVPDEGVERLLEQRQRPLTAMGRAFEITRDITRTG